MTAAWNFVVHVLDTMPAWLAAILVGWAISVGVTQGFKFTLPVGWCEDWRELAARLVAFFSAGLPAAVYYIEQAPGAAIGAVLLVLLGAGLWSPFAFAVLQAVLRRYVPWLADVLSADKRGVVATKLRGGP